LCENWQTVDWRKMNTEEKKRRVLVIHDHAKVLRFIEIDLRLGGFEVIATSSGDEALELVRSAGPDIMLLDVVMPGMNGFEVLKRLRNFSRLPVIAFNASPGNRRDAMRLGANDLLVKPFQPDEMADRIGALLSHC
jgi:two-component system KDP operon response regulator KdpE